VKASYVVTYDICDPRRLRAVFNLMKGYGEHLQYSVFRCDLSDMGLAKLKGELVGLLDMRADQVLFIDLGPADGRAATSIEAVGRGWIPQPAGAVIV
jgi:CRISPR-associated protein Cas2